MKYKKQIITIFLILAAFTLIFTGCGEKSLKGTLIGSVPPSLFWASVGSDSLNHINPVLHWYSTDQDGVVLDYKYAVMTAEAVDALGGVQTVLQSFPVDVPWAIVHTDSATIPLIASEDTSAYISQYIFVKAMDDDSLYSNTIYKVMARNNHQPTCYLIVPTTKVGSRDVPDPQWCLPETTSTFKGIRVAWVGKDSIDIPGIQPDFDWNIRVYGPFVDSLTCDTLPEHLYNEYHNVIDTTNVWIRDKEKYLTNLETGWYMLYARNRDDAYTPSIPALGKLSVYEPTWIRHPELTKQILLANHTVFADTARFATTSGNIRSNQRDSVRAFYVQMVESYLTQAGYSANDYDWQDFVSGNRALAVPKSALYNHKLVIVLDLNYTNQLSDGQIAPQETPYMRYMDVGGMMWVIGRRTFDTRSGRIDFGPSGDHNIAYNYFNLSGAFSQSLTNYRQAEFHGAASLMGEFPDLTVDPAKIALGNWAIARGGETTYYNYSEGLIGVDYLLRRGDSETIYKFAAIDPDTSRFHNFPVAVRFDRGTYKTSYFAFPLFFIQYDQAMEVSRLMLDWFLADRR